MQFSVRERLKGGAVGCKGNEGVLGIDANLVKFQPVLRSGPTQRDNHENGEKARNDRSLSCQCAILESLQMHACSAQRFKKKASAAAANRVVPQAVDCAPHATASRAMSDAERAKAQEDGLHHILEVVERCEGVGKVHHAQRAVAGQPDLV